LCSVAGDKLVRRLLHIILIIEKRLHFASIYVNKRQEITSLTVTQIRDYIGRRRDMSLCATPGRTVETRSRNALWDLGRTSACT